MSQMYQIRLASSVTRTVNVGDSVSYPLKLTGILPEEDLLDLLRQALGHRGFEADEKNPQQLKGRGDAGEHIVVDLDDMTVTARLDEEAEISTEVRADGGGDTRREAFADAQRELAERQRQASSDLEREERRTQKDLTRRLADSEEQRQRQLHEMLQEVYAEALKRKASQLGDVMELREGTSPDGQYELVIKVAAT